MCCVHSTQAAKVFKTKNIQNFQNLCNLKKAEWKQKCQSQWLMVTFILKIFRKYFVFAGFQQQESNNTQMQINWWWFQRSVSRFCERTCKSCMQLRWWRCYIKDVTSSTSLTSILKQKDTFQLKFQNWKSRFSGGFCGCDPYWWYCSVCPKCHLAGQ